MQNAECRMQNAKCKMQNAEPTTSREQRVLAHFAEVRRPKRLRSRVNAKCRMQNAKLKIKN